MEFVNTYSLPEFKELQGAGPRLEVIRNPKTDKLFFQCGSISGAVSTKGYSVNPVVSLVTAGEETFYMLHNKATTNVVDVL
jgi:hypothetical protein